MHKGFQQRAQAVCNPKAAYKSAFGIYDRLPEDVKPGLPEAD
jgi:hypothetical protein